MMNQMLRRIVAILLGLCLMTSAAMAAEAVPAASVLPEETDSQAYRLVRSVVPVGDAVYILTYSGTKAQLWHWCEGASTAEKLGGEMLYAPHNVSMEEAERNAAKLSGSAAEAAYAISLLFEYNEALYGYNGLNHSVFAIHAEGGDVTCETRITLAEYDRDLNNLPTTVCTAGDWLLWYDYNWRLGQYGERLLAFNLTTGAVKQAVLADTIKAISSYKDDKALVVCTDSKDSAAYRVYAYHPGTDQTELLGDVGKGVNIRRMSYSKTLDMMVYQDRTRLMGWTPEGTGQVGYMPVRSDNAQIYAAGNKVFFSTDDQLIQAVGIREGYATDRSLTMMGGTMYTVLSQFYNRYQDVPVYYAQQKNGETWQEILSRETEMPDLYLWTKGSSYMQAVEAGALMDLSVYPEIKAYVEVLYPAFRDIAVQNGGIYGVPVYAASYDGWFINKEVMNEMGLTPADVPTTLDGLLTMAQHWNDTWAEKYPHFTLLNNTTSYRERFYYAIENEWRQLCEKEGKPVNYNDPTYLAVLEQLDGCDFTKLDAALKQTDPEISEYKRALIWTGVKDVGNFDTYMEDYSDRIFIPVTLTADTPYVTFVQELRMWVVNARSESGEYAAALLAESLSKAEGKTAYTLRADKTEPVENDSYAEELEYHMDYLASLEASVADSVNKETALRRVAEQKEYIENGLNGRRYLITPSAIENYRNVIMPAAYAYYESTYDMNLAAEQEELTRQYLRKEITAQELVEALDKLDK